MLRRLALGAALGACLVAAPAASAAVLNGDTTLIHWSNEGAASASSVTVTRTATGFTLTATEATTASATGCTTGPIPANTPIACTTAVRRVWLDLGTGNDTVRVAGVPAITIPIQVNASGGNDVIETGAGNDLIVGGAGSDTEDGGAGNDFLDPETTPPGFQPVGATPSSGNDTITGGLGHDTPNGGTSTSDTFSYDDGRAGPVTATLETSSTSNDGGTADDSPENLKGFENLIGGRGGDDLTGTNGANDVFGRGGNDTIRGLDGADDVRGDDGDDKVDGGLGPDVIRGGEGSDAVTYELRQSAVTVNIGQTGADDGNADDGAGDNIVGGEFEAVIGGSGDDKLNVGNASVGRRLEGRAGNDTLTGGTGAGQDLLVGGTGIDTLAGGSGDDTLEGDSGSDAMDGGGGTDRATYADHDFGVSVTLGDGQRNEGNAPEDGGVKDRLTSIEEVTGSSHNDFLAGDPGVNDIDGGSGNDVVRGGNDVLADVLRGGAGIDTIDYADHAAGVTVSLDGANNEGGGALNDVLSTFEALTGGPGADTLSSTGAATVNGAGGDDAITGSGAADVLDGGSGRDRMNGGAGVDTIRGGDDDDDIDARDGGLDAVDCGAGGADNALTDDVDSRANCELGAPPPPQPTATAVPTAVPTATPTPKPKKPLKTLAVTVFFHFPEDPTRTTLFDTFTISNVPKGAKVVGNCLTRRGRSCKGGLKSRFTIKQKKRRTIKARKFTQKRYPAGTRLEVVISKSGFRNQIKTVTIRDHGQPGLSTRCQKPGAKKRTRC